MYRVYFTEEDLDSMVAQSYDDTILPKLDFKRDFYPNFLRTALEMLEVNSANFFHLTKTNTKLESACDRVRIIIFNLFKFALSGYIEKLEGPEFSSEYIKGLQKRQDIVGEFARFQDVFSKYNDSGFSSILKFFMTIQDNAIQFSSYIPKDLIPTAKKWIIDVLISLGKETKNEQFIQYVKKLKFIANNTKIASITLPKNITVQKIENGTHLILIKDTFLSSKDRNFLVDIMHHCNRVLVKTLMFHNCTFMNDIQFNEEETIMVHTIFRKCTFNKNFVFPKRIRSMLSFRECQIKGGLQFGYALLNGTLRFQRCLSSPNSLIQLSNISYNTLPGSVKTNDEISFDDCLFEGVLMLRNSNISKMKFYIRNSAFLNCIHIKDVLFGKFTEFTNVLFPTHNNEKVLLMKSDLYESLENSGLKDLANSLNLKEKENKKFNLDTYKAELESGNIKSSAAAKYIGKSSGWLAHKRMQDKKEIRYDSIPFMGKGKNITYPVEALNAYKNHDWKKLKELRQKYPIPKESD